MKKIIALLTTLFMALFFMFACFPTTALAADVTITTDGDYNISDYGSGSTITIEAGLSVTLTNTSGTTYTNLKIVCEGAGTKLTIDGVKINDSSNSGTCALAFNGTGNTLTLVGSSTIASGQYEPGIRVESGTELEILGDGSVEVTGGEQSAGIGGGSLSGSGTITISGGTITANGGEYGAGIGGGYHKDSGIITISEGTITAHGGDSAAGIGGGYKGDCEEILISGGTINAYSYTVHNYSGAGIGGGGGNSSDGSGGKITITDGTVTACAYTSGGGLPGSGIGCGSHGPDAEILISGGTIYASSEASSAGIGGGTSGENVSVTISGGTVIAEGYSGIGSGTSADNCTVTINGDAQVTATGSITGIGVLSYSSDFIVTIGGSAQVTATGESSGAGIGTEDNCSDCTVTISGSAQVTATGGEDGGAGIGGGISNDGGTVNISEDAVVNATGGGNGAGIGGGGGTSDRGYRDGGDGEKITISGGTVTATGSGYGAGIGGGGYVSSSYEGGDTGEITLSGGVVYAKSGDSGGMDIGAGEGNTDEGTFVISGNSIVFFSNDSFATPTTSNTYFSTISVDSNGEVYGVALPSGWTEASGYYASLLKVAYDSGGANGTVPESHYILNSDTLDYTAKFPDDLFYSGANFIKWNTEEDGSGTDILQSLDYTTNTDLTLYAIWEKYMTILTLESDSLSLKQSESYSLNASYTPSDAQSTIFWVSSDSSVATVDQSGNVKAVGIGTATIIASSGSRSDTCAVTVTKNPVTEVNLDYSSQSLYKGDVFTISASVFPSDASDNSVTWQSSDTSVATVDNGVVHAVGEGTCTISATADGVSDVCDVTVSKIAVTSVSLNSSAKSLYIGDITTLTSAVSPSNATYQTVTWQSSDTSVATVSVAGVVHAVGEGTATITATADGESDTCAVTVSYKSVTSVTLSDTSVSMYLGDTEALSAAVLPTDAANPAVTWTSSDTSVATVTSGVVQAVGEGACTITATADGVYDTCSVYVGRVAVTSVDLSYSTLSMYVDDQRILTADVSPSDATNPDVTWESSDESVATVNSNGVVTAISVGSATITATADGMSDTCSVTVNEEPDVDVEEVDFIIENSSVTIMYVGDTLQLSVAVTPSDATDTSVTWASSDTSVITVSTSGKVTAVAVGNATITVTAQGNISASYKITVKADESDTDDDDDEEYEEEYEEDEEETETLVVPTETAEATAEPEVIIQYEETDVYLTFDLDVSNLGEDAKYIQLPNDEVIDIEGKDVVSVSILTSDLDDGSLEIVTLDEDMVALGSVTLSAGVVSADSDEDSGLPWFTVIMLIFGVAVTSIGGTLLFVRLVVQNPSTTS